MQRLICFFCQRRYGSKASQLRHCVRRLLCLRWLPEVWKHKVRPLQEGQHPYSQEVAPQNRFLGDPEEQVSQQTDRQNLL